MSIQSNRMHASRNILTQSEDRRDKAIAALQTVSNNNLPILNKSWQGITAHHDGSDRNVGDIVTVSQRINERSDLAHCIDTAHSFFQQSSFLLEKLQAKIENIHIAIVEYGNDADITERIQQSWDALGKSATMDVKMLSNAKDSQGKYILSGDDSKQCPFPDDSLTYKGGASPLVFKIGMDSLEMPLRGDDPIITELFKNFAILQGKCTRQEAAIVKEALKNIIDTIRDMKLQVDRYIAKTLELLQTIGDENEILKNHHQSIASKSKSDRSNDLAEADRDVTESYTIIAKLLTNTRSIADKL